MFANVKRIGLEQNVIFQYVIPKMLQIHLFALQEVFVLHQTHAIVKQDMVD